MIKLAEEENAQEFAETLARKYELKVSADVVASIYASKPKIPALLSRAAFRADAVRTAPEVRLRRERRNFLRNVLGVAAVSLPFLLWVKVAFFSPQAQAPSYVSNPSPQAGQRLLANAANIGSGQSLTLNDPIYGPMLLIHLTNGQFVAYSAICTHAGCQVQFDPQRAGHFMPMPRCHLRPKQQCTSPRGASPLPVTKD